jgi:hypothetical protein
MAVSRTSPFVGGAIAPEDVFLAGVGGGFGRFRVPLQNSANSLSVGPVLMEGAQQRAGFRRKLLAEHAHLIEAPLPTRPFTDPDYLGRIPLCRAAGAKRDRSR